MSTILRKISPTNIIPCHNRICLCIEYLNMNEKQHFERYKQCFITCEINSKYKNTNKNKIYENLFYSYTNNKNNI